MAPRCRERRHRLERPDHRQQHDREHQPLARSRRRRRQQRGHGPDPRYPGDGLHHQQHPPGRRRDDRLLRHRRHLEHDRDEQRLLPRLQGVHVGGAGLPGRSLRRRDGAGRLPTRPSRSAIATTTRSTTTSSTAASASLRVAADADATGAIDVMVGNNDFTVNDHSSGFGRRLRLPAGAGVALTIAARPRDRTSLVFQRGGSTDNYFDEITNASGGVGQLTLGDGQRRLAGAGPGQHLRHPRATRPGSCVRTAPRARGWSSRTT